MPNGLLRYVRQRKSSSRECDSLIVSRQELTRETDMRALPCARAAVGSSCATSPREPEPEIVHDTTSRWDNGWDADTFHLNDSREVRKRDGMCD